MTIIRALGVLLQKSIYLISLIRVSAALKLLPHAALHVRVRMYRNFNVTKFSYGSGTTKIKYTNIIIQRIISTLTKVCVCAVLSLRLCLPVFDVISSDVMDSLILKAHCQ